MNRTRCHSDFTICSNGDHKHLVGFVANENSDFDPEYITSKLGIEPDEIMKMGTPRKGGQSNFPFSKWMACDQTEPRIDAAEQCLSIVRILKEKIPLLLEIKKEFDVTFTISVAPHIHNEETPGIFFDKEIIEFCYLTGTEIGVDLYVYDKE